MIYEIKSRSLEIFFIRIRKLKRLVDVKNINYF